MNKDRDSVELAFWNLDNYNSHAEAVKGGAVYSVPSIPLAHLKSALDSMIGLETMIGNLEPKDTGVMVTVHTENAMGEPEVVQIQTCVDSVEEVITLCMQGQLLTCDNDVQFEWDAEEGVLYVFGSGEVAFDEIQSNLKIYGNAHCIVECLQGNLEARQSAEVLAKVIDGKVLAAEQAQVKVVGQIGKSANTFGDAQIVATKVRGEIVTNNSTYPVQVDQVNNQSFEPLHIQGRCDVNELTEDQRNRLVSVSGTLFAYKSQNLTLPNLQSVGGELIAERTVNLSLPKLQKAEDSLTARESQSLSLPNLESVGGLLCVQRAADLALPELASVGEGLNAEQSQNLSLPKLQSVGGNFFAQGSKNLTLPALQSMDGGLDADYTENLSLPKLQSVELSVYAVDAQNLTIPFELAMTKGVPVEYLSKETLQQGASAKEVKNQRTLTKGVR